MMERTAATKRLAIFMKEIISEIGTRTYLTPMECANRRMQGDSQACEAGEVCAGDAFLLDENLETLAHPLRENQSF